MGAYSPSSQIRARFWNFEEKRIIDKEFLSKVLDQANMRADILEALMFQIK
jgi:23S rRNA G2069 N7-methylase RlmK/C1962 C5-methylase RlmI